MRIPPPLLPVACVLWLLLLVVTPVSAARASAPALTVAVYGAASLLCHQKTDRSFAVEGVQMPVCGRCTGLYAGGALGLCAAWLLGRVQRQPARTARLVLAAAAVPMAVSLGAEWLGVASGSNASRFASALPLGSAAGWVLQSVAAARGAEVPSWRSDIIS